jgi:hypothetical protein
MEVRIMATKNSTSAAQTAAESVSRHDVCEIASEIDDAFSLLSIYFRLLNDQTDWTLGNVEESGEAQDGIIALTRAMMPLFKRVEDAKAKLYELCRAR